MKTLKFRAWDKEKKEMYYVGQDTEIAGIYSPVLEIYGDGKWMLEWGYADDEFDLTEKTGILMQYTGLKDKNGNEIYEGDIITLDGENWKIYWNDLHAGFWYNPVREHDCSINMCYMYQNAEVIGNIYEHGHLIDNK